MLYSSLHCNMTHEICKSDLNPHLEVVWNGSSAGFLLIPVSLSSVTHNDGVLEKYNTRTDTEIHRRLPNPDARYSFHYNSVYEDIFGYVNVTFCVEMRPNSKFTCVLWNCKQSFGKMRHTWGFLQQFATHLIFQLRVLPGRQFGIEIGGSQISDWKEMHICFLTRWKSGYPAWSRSQRIKNSGLTLQSLAL